ncbi:MAG: hypothetical protein Q8K61_02645 [Gallionella sp.]|jgi:hypothetical protein|nr:hypothetical protein [Gallionella sp.]
MNLIVSIQYLSSKLSGRGAQPGHGKPAKKPAAKKDEARSQSSVSRLGQKLDTSA